MVAGKVKVAMGLQKSPANPKPPKPDASPKPHTPSPSSAKQPQKGAVFSRSFGVYFPRSSAQVQPRPPDVTELLRLVEELRDREYRLKTELLEQKLLRESVAIVPVLENQISVRDSELERSHRKVECLEAENERLRQEVEVLHMELVKQNGRYEDKLKRMEAEILELKKANDELATAQRLVDVTNTTHKSVLTKCLRKCATQPSFSPTIDNVKADSEKSKKEEGSVEMAMEISEKPRHSRSNSEEMTDTSESLMSLRSRVPRIKTDVETQGDFIRFLIKEVESAAFTDIEDVVLFVKWLDDELSYLVDERAVLKHFDWPEHKADAMREAAFGYCDLKKIESEASLFRDDPRQPCGPALKKMQALFEKLEHGVYNLSRMRESATGRYKLFQIPMNWMLDTGYASQHTAMCILARFTGVLCYSLPVEYAVGWVGIKLASVKLAMKYMKRVSAELEMVGGGPEEEELIVQGVRFAFRVHQKLDTGGGHDDSTKKVRMLSICSIKNPQLPHFFPRSPSSTLHSPLLKPQLSAPLLSFSTNQSPPLSSSPRIHRHLAAMAAEHSTAASVPNSSMKLLFVEMGVGYDQHGQDITSAAMRACRDAISSNSIPAFRRGSVPGVTFDQMKLEIKLGVPRSLQHLLDIEKIKSVFP
nr:protein CHUP1, chloroplastic [Ipomoea batatas]